MDLAVGLDLIVWQGAPAGGVGFGTVQVIVANNVVRLLALSIRMRNRSVDFLIVADFIIGRPAPSGRVIDGSVDLLHFVYVEGMWIGLVQVLASEYGNEIKMKRYR
jgi:hypothetical protein